MTILITGVICTHNRSGYLRKAILSLLGQQVSGGDYEILVVDNGSTDITRQVVASFIEEKSVRYVYEPSLGLSYARNTGWRNARGEYIAYLDDDAVASPGWLEKILQVFSTVTPLPGCVGGKSDPVWEGIRPRWLSDSLLHGLAVINWGETPHFIDDLSREWLIGANMAIPAAVLKESGGFSAGLDRSGTHLLSSGDVFFEKQAAKKGYPCFYHPQIAITHHIHRSRLNRSWFRRRYFWQGYSDAVMEILEDGPSMMRRYRHALSRGLDLLTSSTTLRDLLCSSDDPSRFTRHCFGLIKVGHIFGLLGEANRCL